MKHSRAIRWFHWINFPLIALMVWSGILIYWANQAYVKIAPWAASALGISYHLARGLGWHFFLALLFAVNGILYVGYLLASGEWRMILPDRAAWKEAWQVLLHDLHLKRNEPPIRGKFNSAQRIAYTAVILMGFGSLLTGLAIYKPVQVKWLTESLGGYEAARLEHFLLTAGFIGFFFVHVLQVIRAGWKNFRAMVTGYEIDPKPGRNRLPLALATGVVFYSLFVAGFQAVRNGPEVDEAPALLRRNFMWDEAVWKKLQSESRWSVKKKSPPPGRIPRFNGSLGLETDLDLAHYKVLVQSGDQEMELPMSAFQALPKSGYSTDFRCIEGWSEAVQYAGARFSDFMKAYHLGQKPDGSYYRYVGFETPDGEYYVSIDIDSMMHPQTVLAYEMNEAPLRLQDGAPLRLMIPLKYGIKHIKRIGTIFFSDTRPPDYWAERGYDWWAGL